jgi:pimeloyl-ACP methyl ester carboxylesterase
MTVSSSIASAAAAPAAFAPLPWEWFDMAGPALRVPPEGFTALEPVSTTGGTRVYRITTQRRVLPFKVFRLASPAPRPVLVMLHGMGLSIATFRGVSPWLLATHDLVLPDYSGLACASAGIPQGDAGWTGRIDVRAMVAGVFDLLDALGIERADFAGNSLGGGMCIVAALEFPARTGKLLLSNPACYPQALPRMYRLARVPLLGELLMTITRPEKLIGGVETIGYVDKNNFLPDLRARYLKNMSTRQNRFRLMGMIRALPANERDTAVAIHVPRLHEIQNPVLITWGEKDPLLVEGAGQRLAKDLPHATYVPFPALAHMPHEEAPAQIGPLWAKFLNTNP